MVSGPSGVGKGTVCTYLTQQYPEVFLSVSATSRKPRPGEIEGVHYFFKTPEEFQRMIENGEFLEYAHYVSSSYGTPKAPCLEHLERGEDVLLEIEVQGGKRVKEQLPETVMIFVAPPSFVELESRLRGRGTEEEGAVSKRLARAREELAKMRQYDYIVINRTVEQTASEIRAILLAERRKTENVIDDIERELKI